MKEYFYSREDSKLKCWAVEPNPLLEGFYVLTDCKADEEGYCEVRPMPGSRYKDVHSGKDEHYFSRNSYLSSI